MSHKDLVLPKAALSAKKAPHLQLALCLEFETVPQTDLYMPTSEQHFLNIFVSFSSLTQWCTPISNFKRSFEVRIIWSHCYTALGMACKTQYCQGTFTNLPSQENNCFLSQRHRKREWDNYSGSSLMNICIPDPPASWFSSFAT